MDVVLSEGSAACEVKTPSLSPEQEQADDEVGMSLRYVDKYLVESMRASDDGWK